MSVIFIVLPLAIVMAGAALLAFAWAVHGGQFDDLDTPAVRMVIEDDPQAGILDSHRRPRGKKIEEQVL